MEIVRELYHGAREGAVFVIGRSSRAADAPRKLATWQGVLARAERPAQCLQACFFSY